MTRALAEPPTSADSAADGPVLTVVDPGAEDAGLSVEDLGSRIVGLAGRLAAVTCQWLVLVAAFDARDGCARFGLASTARWLTHCCGLSHRAPIEHVRVARALVAFPDLAAAMSAGRLSYSHVRAISRLAKQGQERTVHDLIEVAEAGTVGQLETIVRGLRTVDDLENEGDDALEEYVHTGWGANSQLQLNARLDPERGAVVQRAIEAMSAAENIDRVEALERIAEVALAVLADAGQAPALRGEERAAIVVQLDLRVAQDGMADPPTATEPGPQERRPRPPGHILGGPGLPSAALERLLCDGRLRTKLYRDDGSVLDLGRSHRVVSERLFRALLDRDGGCAHPGCHSRAGLEAHHVQHWLHGGRTDLANLVLLCRRHHHSHHRDEFTITRRADGSFGFRVPDGRVLEDRVDPSRLLAAAPALAAATQGVPRWTGTGQRLDRHYAVAVLAQRRGATSRIAS